MKYTHRFRIKAPLAGVAAFHLQPASLGLITPPPMRVALQRFPVPMSGGGEMVFTLWLGPLPIHWTASIENVSESGFTDRQLSGPFAEWVHRHSFNRIDEQATEVVDQISLRLKPHLLWGPVGLGFALGLPALFIYRTWKTRRSLQ